jgi:hypothetical protein
VPRCADPKRKWYTGYEGKIGKDFFSGEKKYDANENMATQCKVCVACDQRRPELSKQSIQYEVIARQAGAAD